MAQQEKFVPYLSDRAFLNKLELVIKSPQLAERLYKMDKRLKEVVDSILGGDINLSNMNENDIST